MSTTIRRWNPAAILLGAALAAFRVLRRLTTRRSRRRPRQPLAGLSDHMLRDIGVARTAVLAFRDRSRKETRSPLGRFEGRAGGGDAGS